MIGPITTYALSLMRKYDPARADRIEGAYRVLQREVERKHKVMTRR